MWLVIGVLSLLCAILVTAALHDLKARRRSRRAHLANPHEYQDHRPQNWKAHATSGIYNTPGGSGSTGGIGGVGVGDAGGGGG